MVPSLTITLKTDRGVEPIVPPMPDEIEATVSRAVADPAVKVISCAAPGGRSAPASTSQRLPSVGRAITTTASGMRKGLRFRDRADPGAYAEVHELLALAKP